MRTGVLCVIIPLLCGGCGTDDKEHVRLLTASEELQIRTWVYNGTIQTSRPIEGPWFNITILVYPNELAAVYTRKPGSTLMLLRMIVAGGAPKDAILAAGFANAIADSPMSAAILVSISSEKDFDQETDVNHETQRSYFLKHIDGYLKKQRQ